MLSVAWECFMISHLYKEKEEELLLLFPLNTIKVPFALKTFLLVFPYIKNTNSHRQLPKC